jgi:hypothetical protein
MKFATIGLFAGLAVALPQRPSKGTGGASSGNGVVELDKPKTLPTSSTYGTIAALTGKGGLLDAGIAPSTRTELNDGKACGKVVFIFARASTEVGNMVHPFLHQTLILHK